MYRLNGRGRINLRENKIQKGENVKAVKPGADEFLRVADPWADIGRRRFSPIRTAHGSRPVMLE